MCLNIRISIIFILATLCVSMVLFLEPFMILLLFVPDLSNNFSLKSKYEWIKGIIEKLALLFQRLTII